MSAGFLKILYNCNRITHRSSVINKLQILRNCCRVVDSCDAERKGLVLGAYLGDNNELVLTPTARKYNDSTNGKLLELLKGKGKILKVGEATTFNNLEPEFFEVAVVGLGNQNLCYNELECIDEGTDAVRRAAGMGVQALRASRCQRVLLEGMNHPEQVGEGSGMAVWRLKQFRIDKGITPTLELYDDPDTESFQRGLFKAECQNLARRLSDFPANNMTPLHFAQEAVNELCPCGIKVEVHDKDWIESKRMNAFLTVARGSCEPPIFLEITYCGGSSDAKPILLAGKGITFDSGGICLKRKTKNTAEYRGDMSGAAIIVALIKAAAGLNLPMNLIGVIPLCENMPSGMAMKPGDLVCAMNNKSIMIENCDNEGRLMLADALCYGQATFKPCMVIDIATLSLGVRIGLGSAASGIFCTSENIWNQLKKAAVITGDRLWRFPLWKYYEKKVAGKKFKTHDVDNKGRGIASSCLSAAFLRQFIMCGDWIHVDNTANGMVMPNKEISYLTKLRMTGCPTRALIQFLYQLSKPSSSQC